MSTCQYVVLLDNEQYGPYNLDTIREMKLMTDILVKTLPGGDFRPASSYPELKDYLITVERKSHTNISVNIDSTSFFYRENGQMYGPLSLWELTLLDIDDNSELSIDDMQHWMPAKNIPGLIDTIHQISGDAERDRLNADRRQISLDKDELEHVIKDQEKDLVDKQKEIQSKNQELANQQKALKDKQEEIEHQKKEIERLKRKDAEAELNLQKRQMEIELMQSQPKIVEHQWVEQPVFDFSSDYMKKYKSAEEDMDAALASLNGLLPKEEKFVKIFRTHDDEVEYRMESYWHSVKRTEEIFEKITILISNVTQAYNDDMQLLEGSQAKLQHDILHQLNVKIKEAQENSQKRIRELDQISTGSKDFFLNTLKQQLDDEKAELTRQLNIERQKGSLKINEIKSVVTTIYDRLKDKLLQAKTVVSQIDHESSGFLEQSYDTASATAEIWNHIEDKKQLPPTRLLLGYDKSAAPLLCEDVVMKRRVFFDFLNSKHLMIHHNRKTKEEAEKFVNTLLGRLISSSRPGHIQVSMIDTEDMNGTSNVLTRLNRQVYSLCVKSDDVRKLLEWTKDHIADIKVNLLQSPINSLQEYNLNKENKEAYQVLVIKGFPCNFGMDSISMLNTILRNGINAGTNVIMLVDDEELERNDDAKRLMSRISEEAMHDCRSIDFINKRIDNNPLCSLETLTDEILMNIVQYVNKGFEVHDEEKVLLTDYLPEDTCWWNGQSSHCVEIPFGITESRQVKKLHIGRTGGTNSAVVIGVSGSGKSVFLHTVICNAAVHYSPDELQLYLIDFSGVEFNTYANHQLPHARVIAPEAEREFGLSVLQELTEEGARRMNIFRENDVNTIADLKEKNPLVKIPRLLVIIDEFQKIFEVDNDKISQEANSKIFTIIKEFGKFGIHLILATQELMSSSVLPKDLIANRVVFKSKPNDFAALVNLPSNARMPLLNPGECIYNNESGSPYANTKVKSFFAKKNAIDHLLDRLSEYSQSHSQKAESLIVFRGNDLPDFAKRRVIEEQQYISDIPNEVGVYFGESIAINETDVCASIRKETGNNILVIGGESDVSQRIAYYATLSLTTAHTDNSASFYLFNFIRGSEAFNEEIEGTLLSMPFQVKTANRLNDVTDFLTEIQTEIETRKNDEARPMSHIYVSIYAFQLARMFDRGGRRGDDVSDCGKLLDYIFRNGPTYGVFVILQVDNLESLSRIGTPMNVFNYRIALQMSENDSNKVVGSSIANKLFVFNRPSSKYRAYYRDNNRNITIKFKPYK